MNQEPLFVGFIGLGTMGFPMASNLITKLPDGSKMYIYDVSADAMNRFKEKHSESVISCSSSKEATENATTVFTMVPEGSHVRAAFLDQENGILAASPAPRHLVDCSTIDRETSLAVLAETRQRHPQATFVDAPVSGGELGAREATLTFMVGCSEDAPALPALRSLLGLMGRHVIPCGGPSLGVTAKLTNNYCSAMISLATAEAMNLGMRAGMDPRLIQRVFSRSTAQSAMCDRWNPVPGVCPAAPSSHGYEGGFKIQLMRKDVGLAVQVAEDVGARLVLADCGLKAYIEASEDPRCRDLDSRVIYRFLGGEEDWEEKKKKKLEKESNN
ncbi:hypothetical protein M406DRAFT_38177 [Cryphonectria parasitica EP155]|uniref:3-hydroxyisobutyrate dehydrogenase n=1 Tax=Cryphonectria parasitica (strain ATCC 38755 / EP155) TaxID=660469 RepID=A0A9P4Y213_CRYP1|nr:uncharacterized protein M406DRAFT_38177 [Cryphonectria parasitica EP155]KAF3765549.1 hypothetical protein M406DRAFT_38177 [Cryphonectria parasitica EP155]